MGGTRGTWQSATNPAYGLLQDGTGRDASGDPYAWFEWIGSDSAGNGNGVGEQPFSISVSPGDMMWFQTEYDASSGAAYFWVLDETTHLGQAAVKKNAQNWYDGRTADWITERPSSGVSHPVPYPLQNFGEVSWTVGKYELQNGSWLKIAQAAKQVNVTMENYADANKILATATLLQGSGGQFQSEFFDCS